MKTKIRLLTPEEAKQIKANTESTSQNGPCAASLKCSDSDQTEIICSGVQGETCITTWELSKNGRIPYSVQCGDRISRCADLGSGSDSGSGSSSGTNPNPGTGTGGSNPNDPLPGDVVSACDGKSEGDECRWTNGTQIQHGRCLTVGQRTYCVDGARYKKAKGIL